MNATLNTFRGRHRSSVSLALVMLALVAAPAVAAITPNLVVDPSFELNPLIGIGSILGPPYTTGAWGAENGANVLAQSGIIPAAGVRMHRMDDDGLVVTQSFQLVDVTPYSAAINAGLATVNANILYNVPQDVAAGLGALYVNYYNAAHAGVAPVTTGTTSILDNNPGTWQNLSINNLVPANTKYLLIQGAFSNATMVNSAGAHRPGYIDGARLTLTIVPEPSTIGLAVCAMVTVVLAARRQR